MSCQWAHDALLLGLKTAHAKYINLVVIYIRRQALLRCQLHLWLPSVLSRCFRLNLLLWDMIVTFRIKLDIRCLSAPLSFRPVCERNMGTLRSSCELIHVDPCCGVFPVAHDLAIT